MRRTNPRSWSNLAALLLTVIVVLVLYSIAVANGLPPGLQFLSGLLALCAVLVNRRVEAAVSRRATPPISGRTTRMSQARPGKHPLWDRWLDG